MSDSRNTWRYVAVALVLLLAWVGLGCKLVTLHLGYAEPFRERLERHRNLEKKIASGRGRIFDRKGRENALAIDLPLKNVIADAHSITTNGQIAAVAERLAPLINMSRAELAVRLNRPGRRYEPIKRYVEEDVVRRIQALRLPGIFFSDVMVRHYPQNDSMCHVLGFVNHEGVGSSGIEQVMNRHLVGRMGRLESKLDGARREMYDRRTEDVAPVNGADVYLTIDQHLQYAAERSIDRIYSGGKAKGAWTIIQSVKTGEILAMASRPSFNLNEFTRATEQQRLNRAIGTVYEPGSTMKALTLAGVLNEGLVSPSDRVFCENGAWLHSGRILNDTHPYGELTVADVLKKSSNIGTAKMALMLGNKRLAHYLADFGVGARSGIDLPGEEAGIFHPVKDWSGVSCSRIAIGQGVAVTALQMLDAYCTIANDGVRMRPHVVRRVVGPDGAVLYEQKPQELGRPIKRETALLMQKLLARVTEDGGTGVKGRVAGYTVAGKTGTAQKAVAGGYSSTAYVASFVGFLPAERPEIGVIVVVDEPQSSHMGGVVAAPAFSEIAGLAVRYLDIEPFKQEYQMAANGRR